MKAIAYDTETTGLPNWGAPSDDPSQPRVIQLHAELFDTDTKEVHAVLSHIIKPDGWTIPEDIQKMTGITMETAESLGVPMHEVLPKFIDLWQLAAFRVAHNESFDMRMIRIEIMRHAALSAFVFGEKPLADIWKKGEAFCTQTKSNKIIKLPPTPKMIATKRFGYKSPNLGEAYKFFTGKELEGAHDAGIDVMACKEVYFGIQKHLQEEAA